MNGRRLWRRWWIWTPLDIHTLLLLRGRNIGARDLLVKREKAHHSEAPKAVLRLIDEKLGPPPHTLPR
jgi:hypothetical protein